MRALQFSGKATRLPLLGTALLGTLFLGNVAQADTTPQPLPFAQNWSNVDLITVTQDWSGVPGIIGYRGDNLTDVPGNNPQGILGDGSGTLVNVVANAATPVGTTPGGGGIYEFDKLDNPVVAFQGSGTADAPHLVFTLNTTGNRSIRVAYNLRDVDPQPSAAIQQVALQYRIGTTGDYIDVPTAYVANAAGVAGEATKVTAVAALLPDAANDQAVVQVRVITADANGSDELIGVDDINVTGTLIGGTAPPTPSSAAHGDPNSVAQGATTLLTAKITLGTNPDSSGIAVTGDLTSIGGSATQAFFDDATNGDAMANDNLFSYTATVPATVAPGAKSLPVAVVDAQSRTAATTIGLTVTQVFRASTTVVISEFRSRNGANAGDEFVELYNLSGAAVDLSGYVLRNSSAGGTLRDLATIGAGVSLPAGARYLFTATGGPLEAQGDANFGATIADNAGIAIFDAAGSRVDAVGADNSPNASTPYREGTGVAPLTASNIDQSYERLALGINNQDTENNVADFQLTTANPQSLKPAPVNNAPMLNNATYSTSINVPFSQQLAGSDADAGDTLAYMLATGALPDGLTLSSTGLISGTPTTAGRSDFSVNLSDGRGTTNARFIIIVSTNADGIGPNIVRTALPNPITRDPLAGSTVRGTITDVAPNGVTPTGVARMFVQLRTGNTSYSGPTDGFTTNTNRGYYTVNLGAPAPATTAGTRDYERSLSFIPAQLAPGSYSLVFAGQDVAGNYSVEVVPLTIVAPAASTLPPVLRVAPSNSGATS